jgi:hypothetical protein
MPCRFRGLTAPPAIIVIGLLWALALADEQTPTTTASADGVIRIDAGAEEPYTDAKGRVWLSDQGFVGGDIVDRGEIPIDGAEVPAVYWTERFNMESFSWPVPNGAYTVRLHFADTYSGTARVGARVFTVTVEGSQAIKELDVFKQSGGANKALVVAVQTEVRDGRLSLEFKATADNSEINAIEIVPAAADH